MAVGKCADEQDIEPHRTTIRFGPTAVFELGSPVECDLEALQKYLGQKEVEIGVELGIGSASARVWGCDLTEGYVRRTPTTPHSLPTFQSFRRGAYPAWSSACMTSC